MLPFGGIYRAGRGPEWMLRCQGLLRNYCLLQKNITDIAQVAAQNGRAVVKGYCGYLNNNFLYEQ